jgi:hypothetical protein
VETPNNNEVTQLLANLRNGQNQAQDQLFPIVYSELRKIAANYMRRERADHLASESARTPSYQAHLVGEEEPTERAGGRF